MRKLIISIFNLVVLTIFGCSFSTFAQTSVVRSDPTEVIAHKIEVEFQSLVRKGNLPSLQVAVDS